MESVTFHTIWTVFMMASFVTLIIWLMSGRQKSAGPQRRSGSRPAWTGLQNDETGQVAGFAAQAIRSPRSHARTARLR